MGLPPPSPFRLFQAHTPAKYSGVVHVSDWLPTFVAVAEAGAAAWDDQPVAMAVGRLFATHNAGSNPSSAHVAYPSPRLTIFPLT